MRRKFFFWIQIKSSPIMRGLTNGKSIGVFNSGTYFFSVAEGSFAFSGFVFHPSVENTIRVCVVVTYFGSSSTSSLCHQLKLKI